MTTCLNADTFHPMGHKTFLKNLYLISQSLAMNQYNNEIGNLGGWDIHGCFVSVGGVNEQEKYPPPKKKKKNQKKTQKQKQKWEKERKKIQRSSCIKL